MEANISSMNLPKSKTEKKNKNKEINQAVKRT